MIITVPITGTYMILNIQNSLVISIHLEFIAVIATSQYLYP